MLKIISIDVRIISTTAVVKQLEVLLIAQVVYPQINDSRELMEEKQWEIKKINIVIHLMVMI